MAVRDSETGSGGEERQEPIEVEVERLNQEGASHSTTSSYGQAIGPVLAGFIIDVLDLSTFGPAGLYLGALMGCPAGWYLARSFGLDRRRSLYVALACGVYCTIPITSPIPLATLIGVWLRVRQPD